MPYDAFLSAYPAESPRTAVTEEVLEGFRRSLPEGVLDLWQQVGFGKLRDGLFELVDPSAYTDAFTPFFGGDAGGRVPFLLNAFGEPISYRRIGAAEGEFAILHPYGPKLEVLAYSERDFFGSVLLEQDSLRMVINLPLFLELRSRLRRLRAGEAYGFDPGLLREEGADGKADASFFEVVDAAQQLRRLYTWADED